MPSPPAPYVASYRLQLTPELTFDAATEVLDHLAAMGVSHVYLSPIAEAVPGSLHGYDVVDHRQVRAELGGEAGLRRLLDAALTLGLRRDHRPRAEPLLGRAG